MNNKTLFIQEYVLPITIVEEKQGVFIASCSSWQDCYAQGTSVVDVIKEISFVADSLLEVYKEEDLSIPLRLKKVSN